MGRSEKPREKPQPEKHVLEIVERPDHKLAPKSGRRTKVRTGDTVFFRAEDGVEDPGLSFDGEVPFAGGKVQYGRNLIVSAEHKPDGKNVYTFTCSFTKNGVPLSTPGGGELEVLPSDG
jgi:hypothetical protein